MNAPRAEALCVIFQAGADVYALPATDVFKIIEPRGVNTLPRLPAAIRGITQHRGRIVTVVDLAKLFDGERDPGGPDARVIILDRSARHLGLFVRQVEAIVPVAGEGTELRALIQHQGRAINLLSTARLAEQIERLGGS